jgi:hypothetical protein
MKYRSAKTLLSLIILNLMIYAFSFAQVDLANIIIEEKIDELWTNGKLNIGYADIASKHWLPGLYERNDFQLLWQDPQKDVYDRDQPVLEGLNEEFSIWQRRAFED